MKSIFLIIILVISTLNLSAQAHQYQYDRSGKLTNANYNGRKSVSYSYDKDGNRTSRANILCNGPSANFSASQITGNCPLTVNFNNSSTTQGTTTYEWTIYTDTTGTPSVYSTQNPTGVVFNYGGTFQVSLKVIDACGTSTKTLPGYITVVCSPASIATVPIPSITIFPNPTNDKVTLQGTNVPGGIYSLELSDVWGRLLQTIRVEAAHGALSTVVPLTPYASGTYFLKVSSGTTIKSFKITKE